MADDRNGADVTIKAFGTETNVKNIKSLNTALTLATLIMVTALGVFLWQHAEGSDKTSQALLREIQQSNKANADTQKNIAFYQCRAACLVEQPPEKKDGAACDRTCGYLRP
jgi:hypothetical protein